MKEILANYLQHSLLLFKLTYFQLVKYKEIDVTIDLQNGERKFV